MFLKSPKQDQDQSVETSRGCGPKKSSTAQLHPVVVKYNIKMQEKRKSGDEVLHYWGI